ncbi:MAG: insulinase family protein [Planctomycetes bacterium]|nr:insulinase family protein [Planctomycetota bacterium]
MAERFAGFEREDVQGVPFLVRRDPRSKTFRMVLYARRPLDRDAAARALLPALLQQGTRRDPDRPALARRMEMLYGASVGPGTAKVGESHVLRMSVDAVAGAFLPGRPDQLGAGAQLLRELLCEPLLDGMGFPSGTFERERKQAADAVRALRDDKGAYAAERAIAEACAGEPYAIPEHGGLAAIEALDRGAPERARLDFLTRGEMVAFAAGALPEAGVAARLGELLAAMPARAPEPLRPPVSVAPRPVRRAVERTLLQQSKLHLHFRLPGTDVQRLWIGRRLFTNLLGGGPHSRLFREVRERRSLAYYASAGLERHKGLLQVHVGCDERAAAAVEEEVLRQARALQAGEFQEQELETARAQILGTLATVDDSPQARLAFAAESWFLGVDRTPDEWMDLYRSATRDEVVQGAAGLWLDHVYLLGAETPAGGIAP